MNEVAQPALGPNQLSKALESRHVTMISIGGIIGAGLFVGSSAAIAAIGPATIVSYILAGILVLCIMRMVGELAAAHPHLGSFTDLIREGLGDCSGFVAGWLYWYFWVVVVAIEAIAGAVILQEWLPLAVWQIGLMLMVIMTAVNLLSTRSYGELEFWFASIKVAAIVVFIAIGGAYLTGVGTSSSPGLANLYRHDGFAPYGWAAALSGVVTVFFSLTGAEIATIAAAESKEPAKAIARLTSSVATRIVLFFVLSMVVICAVVPWNEIVPGTSPFATALERIGTPGAATIMKLVVLTAVLSCLNSGMYVTSRMLFNLAARGHASSNMTRLNERKVPARAILISSVFGFAAVIASVASPQGVFAFLVNASGAIMLIVYGLAALSQIKRRKELEASEPERLIIRMWLFPGLSYAVIAGIAAVLIAMALEPDLLVQLITSLAVTALAIAAYPFRGRLGLASPGAR